MVQRYGASYLTIHRADLHQILLEALQALPEAHLNLDQFVSSYSQQDGVVTIRTSTGKLIEGDALIGADGVRSAVRAQMLGDGPPRVTGHLAYQCPGASGQSAQALAHQRGHGLAGSAAARHSVPRAPRRAAESGGHCAGAGARGSGHWDHSANLPDLLQHLQGMRLPAGSGAACSRCGWRMAFVAGGRPAAGVVEAQMAQGLVALLGDAAHPMRPYLAQGAGMAIEDAAELQSALSMHDLDVSLRLRRYALNRWQRNARVQERSLRNGRIFHATGPVALGRDLSLRALGGRIMDVPWLYEGAL
jgi:salicylate hydroxylase